MNGTAALAYVRESRWLCWAGGERLLGVGGRGEGVDRDIQNFSG